MTNVYFIMSVRMYRVDPQAEPAPYSAGAFKAPAFSGPEIIPIPTV